MRRAALLTIALLTFPVIGLAGGSGDETDDSTPSKDAPVKQGGEEGKFGAEDRKIPESKMLKKSEVDRIHSKTKVEEAPPSGKRQREQFDMQFETGDDGRVIVNVTSEHPEFTDAQAAKLVETGNLKLGDFCEKAPVEETIQSHRRGFARCFGAAAQDDPEASGDVDLQAKVGLDGKVKSATIVESDLGSRMTRGCLTYLAKKWSFPKPDGGICILQTTLTFTSPKEAGVEIPKAGQQSD
jgi:hypothetical protein